MLLFHSFSHICYRYSDFKVIVSISLFDNCHTATNEALLDISSYFIKSSLKSLILPLTSTLRIFYGSFWLFVMCSYWLYWFYIVYLACAFLHQNSSDPDFVDLLFPNYCFGKWSDFIKGIGGGSRPKKLFLLILIYIIAPSFFFPKWGHTLFNSRYSKILWAFM